MCRVQTTEESAWVGCASKMAFFWRKKTDLSETSLVCCRAAHPERLEMPRGRRGSLICCVARLPSLPSRTCFSGAHLDQGACRARSLLIWDDRARFLAADQAALVYPCLQKHLLASIPFSSPTNTFDKEHTLTISAHNVTEGPILASKLRRTNQRMVDVRGRFDCMKIGPPHHAPAQRRANGSHPEPTTCHSEQWRVRGICA